ncbi:MAG: SAM-dependent methyltransferase, partial [Myxococcota bacterium]
VLRPDGLLLFCEHGQAPDGDVQRWQRLVEPVWSACGGGCRLTRPIPTLIQAAGFRIQDLETMYLPNTPRFAGFNYWGSATP